MRVAILGAGNWGATFALMAHHSGHRVTLWEYDAVQAKRVSESRENIKFLPGYVIPRDIGITNSLDEALRSADVVLLAMPAQTCRGVLKSCGTRLESAIIVSLIKGIEQQSLQRVSEIAAHELTTFDSNHYAVLSGPTIAPEVAAGLPTSAAVASNSKETAELIQTNFTTPSFRLYTSDDVTGVELAGALKNVIALAAGICDGMSLGYNAKGMLITRGLVEMSRLGEALGGKRSTFAGLSGMGDLVTTCSSPQSRNRVVGERIGRGEILSNILSSMVMVAEGVWTARAAQELARQHNVSVPITDAVCDVLFDGKSPRDAVSDLMVRTLKSEN